MKLLVDTNKVPFQQVSRKKEYPGVGKILCRRLDGEASGYSADKAFRQYGDEGAG